LVPTAARPVLLPPPAAADVARLAA
jgi:hypothetical protein